mgnify:CR=1 FL=1
MGLLEFNKLPINTLVGADWKTFKDITGGRDIGAAYKGKYRLTKAVCRLLSTLAPLQDRRYEKQISPWSMIRYSFWDTGVAGLRLCIMFSPATSISATTRHTRLYFRIL